MEIYRWPKWVRSGQSQTIIQLFPVQRSHRFRCRRRRSIEAVILPLPLRQTRKIIKSVIAYELIVMAPKSKVTQHQWPKRITWNSSSISTITITIELTRTATIRVKAITMIASKAKLVPNNMPFRHQHRHIISKKWQANIRHRTPPIMCIRLALMQRKRTSMRPRNIINLRRQQQSIHSIKQRFRQAIAAVAVKSTSAVDHAKFVSNWKHKIWHRLKCIF